VTLWKGMTLRRATKTVRATQQSCHAMPSGFASMAPGREDFAEVACLRACSHSDRGLPTVFTAASHTGL